MARINPGKRMVTLKVVYYGPGLSGKTSNISSLHDAVPASQRGRLVKLDTETERTLFFDYFPAGLGMLGQFKVVVDYFSVPGQSFYNETRRILLDGVDALVFVADSSPLREDANLMSLKNLDDNLRARGLEPSGLPTVFQWNKRDLPDALPTSLLARQLLRPGCQAIEAVASRGEGVRETAQAALKLALARIRGDLGLQGTPSGGVPVASLVRGEGRGK